MRILENYELYTGILVRANHFLSNYIYNYIYELSFEMKGPNGEYAYRAVYFINNKGVTEDIFISSTGDWQYVDSLVMHWFETDITRNLNLQKIREEKLKLLGF